MLILTLIKKILLMALLEMFKKHLFVDGFDIHLIQILQHSVLPTDAVLDSLHHHVPGKTALFLTESLAPVESLI